MTGFSKYNQDKIPKNSESKVITITTVHEYSHKKSSKNTDVCINGK